MNTPVPSPEANAASKGTASVPVEIRYADYRVASGEVFVYGVAALLFFVLPWLSGDNTRFYPILIGALFVGVGLFNVVYVRRRFRKAGPAITLDERGLHSTPWYGQRLDVDWDEIDSLVALRLGGKSKRPYLGIRLKHPERRSGLTSVLRHLQGSHLQVLTEGLQVPTDQLVALIHDYRARLGC